LLLRRLVERLADRSLALTTAIEIEWVVSDEPGDEFHPGIRGPAYGMARLIDASDYALDLITSLTEEGVEVEQFHPEYAPGQLELSVRAESPLDAADTSVLVRSTIRAVGEACGLRTSYSPKVAVPGVGNGGHVHFSLWREETNLMTGGDGPFGLTREAAAFSAGVLAHLPGLMAVGAPSVVSYLRHVPSHWAGTFACWGLENREAAMRMVTGSTGSSHWAANLETKCFDLHANPDLLLAGIIAAGLDGLARDAVLTEPVDVDPAVYDDGELGRRGISRLPQDLRTATDAFATDDVLRDAFGPALTASILAVRESEIELFDGVSDEELAAATRWQH
jgi:glutamine synthetase